MSHLNLRQNLINFELPLINNRDYNFVFYSNIFCHNCLVVCLCAVVGISMCIYWIMSLAIKFIIIIS